MEELTGTFGRTAPPGLSVFQICVLNGIGSGTIKNVELRASMRALGFQKSGPGFSVSMQSLEQAGLVESWYTQAKINRHAVREKHFKLTEQGREALAGARRFFERFPWRTAGTGVPVPARTGPQP